MQVWSTEGFCLFKTQQRLFYVGIQFAFNSFILQKIIDVCIIRKLVESIILISTLMRNQLQNYVKFDAYLSAIIYHK